MKDNVEKLLRHKKEKADQNLRLVFQAVWDLRKTGVKEIRQYLRNKAEADAQSRYESGAIDKINISSEIEKNLMVREVIHRKLNELEQLGLVEHAGQEYIISDAWIGDLRYFVDEKAQEFGQEFLGRLTQRHYPTKKNFNDNLKELIEIYGFFMLYCLLEACRPVPFKSRHKRPATPNLFNDKLTIKWASNVFDPVFILGSFVSAIRNQTDDPENKGKKLKVKEFEVNEGFFPDGPPSTAYFHRKLFLERYSDEGYKEYYDDKKTKPIYQLSEKMYNRTLVSLEKLFPCFFKAAMSSRADFFGRPKEFSLKSRYSKKMPLEVGES